MQNFIWTANGNQPIAIKCRIVSLPVALTHPHAAQEMLIVHRSVNNQDADGWTVTHQKTGFRFAGGRTMKAALEAAQAVFNKYPDESIMRAIEIAAQRTNH